MDFLAEYKATLAAEAELAATRKELASIRVVSEPQVVTPETQTLAPPVRSTDTGAVGGVPRTFTSLDAIMSDSRLDLVEIDEGGSILVVEAPPHVIRPQLVDTDIKDIQMHAELGRTGMSRWSSFAREEYNPELRDRLGLMKYDRMRRSDGSVRASLRVMKSPILGATWFMQPFDETDASRKEAQFMWRALMDFPTYTWIQMMWESLLMLDFGYYMFEKVYDFKEVDGERRVIYKKLAPRHPLDVTDWHFDRNGGPKSVDMYDEDEVNIDIKKLAVFTFDGESGDIRGISVLRSAYKHWYFKENLYKIDAIQKERHGIGIPVIKLPPGYSPSDKALAQEMGMNLRTNERAHVILPPNFELMFLKLEGQRVDALASVKHHTEMVFQNVLAQAIYAAAEGDAQSMMDLFYKSVRYIADLVRGVYNKYCVPYLIQANFDHDRYPELKVRRLGDTAEARTISFALRNLVGSSIVQPDDDLEDWSREIVDAPRRDPKTTRETSAPQAPGGDQPAPGAPGQPKPSPAKPPRQAPAAGGMQQGKSAGRGNTGFDQGGGG
jgi:hypothetical protein